MRGTLYIVAAPSGAGKSSLVNALAGEDDFLFPWEFLGIEGGLRYFDEADSTMDRALTAHIQDPGWKGIVIAEAQERGRGRRGRRWSSERGGIFMTRSPPAPPGAAAMARRWPASTHPPAPGVDPARHS